ncbi:hypothetical protein V8E36_004229 [Tilletia maclaganii]
MGEEELGLVLECDAWEREISIHIDSLRARLASQRGCASSSSGSSSSSASSSSSKSEPASTTSDSRDTRRDATRSSPATRSTQRTPPRSHSPLVERPPKRSRPSPRPEPSATRPRYDGSGTPDLVAARRSAKDRLRIPTEVVGGREDWRSLALNALKSITVLTYFDLTDRLVEGVKLHHQWCCRCCFWPSKQLPGQTSNLLRHLKSCRDKDQPKTSNLPPFVPSSPASRSKSGPPSVASSVPNRSAPATPSAARTDAPRSGTGDKEQSSIAANAAPALPIVSQSDAASGSLATRRPHNKDAVERLGPQGHSAAQSDRLREKIMAWGSSALGLPMMGDGSLFGSEDDLTGLHQDLSRAAADRINASPAPFSLVFGSVLVRGRRRGV